MGTVVTIRERRNWRHAAACHAYVEEFFGPAADQRLAARICRDCPVRTQCLAEALDGRIEHGVWGGLTERQRRALLRRRPEDAA